MMDNIGPWTLIIDGSIEPESSHMATNKKIQTLGALNAQIAALQAQAEALRKKEVEQVIAQAKEAIRHYGLTAVDLGLVKAAGRPRKAAGGAPVGVIGRKRSGAKPGARPAKFKDEQGHTWSGIGKRPDWFKAALAAGKTSDELLCKA
jgi:DNA-binding protein H-NS